MILLHALTHYGCRLRTSAWLRLVLWTPAFNARQLKEPLAAATYADKNGEQNGATAVGSAPAQCACRLTGASLSLRHTLASRRHCTPVAADAVRRLSFEALLPGLTGALVSLSII